MQVNYLHVIWAVIFYSVYHRYTRLTRFLIHTYPIIILGIPRLSKVVFKV
jgi:hypothetical protein